MTSKEYIKQKNKEMGISKYYTNKQVRERIDSYLKRNASIWANLGTGSKLDVGNQTQAKKEWKSLQGKIKSLDPIFWEGIKQ
jgi:hypothetical protein